MGSAQELTELTERFATYRAHLAGFLAQARAGEWVDLRQCSAMGDRYEMEVTSTLNRQTGEIAFAVQKATHALMPDILVRAQTLLDERERELVARLCTDFASRQLALSAEAAELATALEKYEETHAISPTITAATASAIGTANGTV